MPAETRLRPVLCQAGARLESRSGRAFAGDVWTPARNH